MRPVTSSTTSAGGPCVWEPLPVRPLEKLHNMTPASMEPIQAVTIRVESPYRRSTQGVAKIDARRKTEPLTGK